MKRFFRSSNVKAASRALYAFCVAWAFLLVVSPMQQPVLPANGAATELTAQQQAAADLCQIDTGRRLIPLGRTTGIKLYSKGTMLVGFSDLDCCGYSPAQQAGLREGDIILALNGCEIGSNEALAAALKAAESPSMTLTVLRDDVTREMRVRAVYDEALGYYRIGAWIRDSIAGIGTITFVDPDTGAFGALGHGICDTDTGDLVVLDSGSVMESIVTDVIPGKSGTPGQLTGQFNLKEDQGILVKNTDAGIFGKLDNAGLYANQAALPLAEADEIKTGDAYILSNVDGITTERYAIRIVKVFRDKDNRRDMLIEVTDSKLLQATGGIVQGMSGSPIVQNGKLVGAVTHVLVNDPTRGYGIFIENMLEAAG